MKKILVPTDFSKSAKVALDTAVNFCRFYKAELHIVHAYNPSSEVLSLDFVTPFQGVPGTMAPEQINEFMEERKKGIEENLQKIADEFKNEEFAVKTSIENTALFEDLAEQVDKMSVDLVIMGTHGASGARETFIGSNAQKFIRHCKTPVLTLREPLKNELIYHTVFASSFSKEGEKRIYDQYRSLFAKQPVNTHFLLVNTPKEFMTTPKAEDRIEAFLRESWPSKYTKKVYNDYTVEEGIVNYASERSTDVIVMATHGYTGISRWFNNSLTESVINHSKLPVLSFNLD